MNDSDATRLFDEMVKALWEKTNAGDDIWSDGEMILCKSEAKANAIADLINALYECSCAVTGYYDPEEDERFALTDEYTGYWYVEID